MGRSDSGGGGLLGRGVFVFGFWLRSWACGRGEVGPSGGNVGCVWPGVRRRGAVAVQQGAAVGTGKIVSVV